MGRFGQRLFPGPPARQGRASPTPTSLAIRSSDSRAAVYTQSRMLPNGESVFGDFVIRPLPAATLPGHWPHPIVGGGLALPPEAVTPIDLLRGPPARQGRASPTPTSLAIRSSDSRASVYTQSRMLPNGESVSGDFVIRPRPVATLPGQWPHPIVGGGLALPPWRFRPSTFSAGHRPARVGQALPLQPFFGEFKGAEDGPCLILALFVFAGGDRVGHDAGAGLQVGGFIFD